ncbi:MAG: tetratricopeptide repeat protein [Gammaproteobacteria bacterium]|nr:tetratricopeptide repeat protein [Gammaproteobacteria bacterium]
MRLTSIVLLSMLVGCMLFPDRLAVLEPTLTADQLLSGVAVFGEEISSDEVADVDVLALDEPMKAFIEEHVGRTGNSVARFRRLLSKLESLGYFSATYDAGSTNSAIDTFHNRAGNCLSFTNLFVALGREAKLDTVYQIVDVPASWDANSGYLIRFTHINVVVGGAPFNRPNSAQYTVDFNDVVPDSEHRRRKVSDGYAQGLFYGNLSVSELRDGEVRRSFAYLKKALELAPDNADMWINLGAFFASQSAHEEAIQSYRLALDLKRSSKTAFSGLARSFAAIGEEELAESYSARVRSYRARNPFYHFAVAQVEFRNSNYKRAIQAIDKAIDLKRRNPRFHLLRALAEQQLGDDEAAEKSFDRVKRYGKSDQYKLRIREDMISLNPPLPVS